MLLGLLGRALGLSPDFALILAALFLAHPIHTESAPQQPSLGESCMIHVMMLAEQLTSSMDHNIDYI